jgi:hypothetical protein
MQKFMEKIEVTNNEFRIWVVKGYIPELMDLQVDCATTAASTIHILAS